ncbi:MAG: PhoPQ-activated pathogenicity-related protein [Gemmataceae bacterium]|nr:PhoPQ-activated pathogenicity-related protein [Gemmataceae bacterium]
MPPRHFLLAILIAGTVPGFVRADSPAPPSDLPDYVRKEDKSFAWKLAGKTEVDAGAVYEIDLISQTWHDIKWTHKLQVFVPKGGQVRPTMVLWNQGGTPSPASGLLGLQIARKVGAPVAFLYGVPNQPLFGGKREDALIAETFVRFLETKDPTWPLLFPMVKSLVKAMDALQAFAREEWKADVKDFVVTGASKRGWTSWLTAATGDRRVKAIAPLVIDTLNFPVQMKNQVAAFGKPSAMISDYTERKLVPIPDTGDGRRLWTMVDPWVYREAIAVPKMIINGANDPYWPLDALNSYWTDLKGDKYLLYVPNAGHNLRETDKDGKQELLPGRAVNTLSAFCKSQVFAKTMPKLAWKHTDGKDGADNPSEDSAGVGENDRPGVIEVESSMLPARGRIWRAYSETRDFRKARWESTDWKPGTDNPGGTCPRPAMGFAAFFAECDYEVDGLTFTLSTQIRILEAKK